MTETQDTPDWQHCLARAEMLIERDRYGDAAEWCQRGLQGHPDNSRLHALLAMCWMSVEGKAEDAVQSARRSVGLDPDHAWNHAVLALAISHKAKPGQDGVLREALAEARKALELDAWLVMAHAAHTQVLVRLQRYREAEESARAALAIDPENPHLGAQLGMILQLLGKHEDHEHLAHSHLAQHPESEAAHSSAGFNALRKGDHKGANAHFLEALRLDPTSEAARMGLAESYRARSWSYRLLLRMDAAITRLTGGRETAFWIGGFIAYRVLYKTLSTTAPALAWTLVAAWLLLVFWSALSRGVGSFFMLFDRSARHSLARRERWEGGLVGAMVGLAIMCLGFGVLLRWEFAVAALGLFLGATPVSAAFTNDHHIGRWLYGAVTAFCVICALYFVAFLFIAIGFHMVLPSALTVCMSGIFASVAFSWVRAFGILYR
jgi:tetratricopeptide (TPR) repeat protein